MVGLISKNVLESKEIVELLPSNTEKISKNYLCPVCHMQLEANETDFQYMHEGETFYFCSNECKEVFEQYQLYRVA